MKDPEEPAELAWPLPIQSLLMMGYTSACADVTHTPFNVGLKEAEKKTNRHHVRDLYNAFHGHCLPSSWELCKLGDLLVQIRTVRLSGVGGLGLTRELGIYEVGLWMCAAVCQSSVPGDLEELTACCSAAEDLFLHTRSSSRLSRGFVVRRWEQVHPPAKPSEGDTSFLVVTPPHSTRQ